MEFDRFAGDYKNVLDSALTLSGEGSEYFSRYKANYLRRLLTPAFSGRVLDFGCGIGMLARSIKQALPDVTIDGFDVSDLSIQRIDPDLRSQGVFSSSLSEVANEYRLIVVANVMHHIPPEERKNVIDDLSQRLAPGGMIAIFEHNPANPLTRWIVERCPFDSDAILLGPKVTASYLSRSGLKVKRRDYIVFLPKFLGLLRLLEPALWWLPAGAQYAMVAEKCLL